MAASPDAPTLTNLFVAGGKALVSVLETQLVAPVEAEAHALRQQQRVEAEASVCGIAPWQTLAEQYSILEDELRVRILRISTSEGNFSTRTAAQGRRRPGNILPGCLPMANAALAEDEPLRELRFRLVPARMSEEDFWRCYFWHVANVKCELLHDWRTANGARRAAALEEEASLAPVADEADPASSFDQVAGGAEASGVDADDLDAEFERLVSSPSS